MADSLFKYQTFSTAQKVLKNKTIRFSAPETFNDPYDANPPYVFANNNIDKDKLEFLQIALKVFSKNSLILCLSLINNNLLMWGHYADCHKGVVIEFDGNAEVLHLNIEVNYKKEIVLLDDNLEECPDKGIKHFVKALYKIFTTKNECWQYEKEVRIIKDNSQEFLDHLKESPNPAFSSGIIENFSSKEYRDYQFKPEDIKTVYLGAKMRPKEQNEIIEIIKKDYPHIKTIYKARLSESEYAIIFEEISI